jgi:hypothetical protein
MSLIASAVISALHPIFAHVSVYLLIISRMVMGVFQAAVFPGQYAGFVSQMLTFCSSQVCSA